MKSLAILKNEAMESCAFRGHKMGTWEDRTDGKASKSQCTICDAWVAVEINPIPNGIDIGGPAVAVGCKNNEKRIFKTFNDSVPGGKPVTLEAELVDIYMDDDLVEWTVYKPISPEWQGVYHLVPFDGGDPWIPTDLDERRKIARWEATVISANEPAD